MRIGFTAVAFVALLTVPAAAGDVELYQVGQSNWFASNQYDARNNVKLFQEGTNTNGNNYASLLQQGDRNTITSGQLSKTDNTLVVDQAGVDNYVKAVQDAAGFNRFSLKQTTLSRR